MIWLLTGIWHGSTANFLLWGLYFFLLIMLELCCKKLWKRVEKAEAGIFLCLQEKVLAGKTFLEKRERRKQVFSILLRCLQHAYTLLLLYFSWILFRFSDFQSLKNALLIHTFPKNLPLLDEKTLLIGKSHIFLLLLAILFSGNLLSSLEEEWQKLLFRGKSRLARKKRASLGFYGMEDMEEIGEEGIGEEETVEDEAAEDETPGEETLTEDREEVWVELAGEMPEVPSPLHEMFPEEKYPVLKLTLDSELPTNISSNSSSDMPMPGEMSLDRSSDNPSESSSAKPSEMSDFSSNIPLNMPLNMPGEMPSEGMLSAEEVPEESDVKESVIDESGVEESEAEESEAEELESEESEKREEQLRHEKILRRIQRRTKLSIFFLDHAEQLYFWGKLLAAIAFLLLSFALMAGQSYMPFLYNQF